MRAPVVLGLLLLMTPVPVAAAAPAAYTWRRAPGPGTLVRDTLDYSDLDHAVQADVTPEVGRVTAEGTDTVRVHGQMGVVGTAYDDTLTGSPKADTLKGLGGDDRLEGRGGNDLLLPGGGADAADGDFGNDVINSWGGADVLRGGPGNDFVDTQSNPDVASVSLGPGGDQLNTDVRPRGGFDADAGTGRDTIVLGYTRHHDLPAADLDLGSGAVTLGASATGRLASFEWWVMLDDQPLTIHGTDASERIEAGGQGPVTAWMGGGNDAVFASGSDDYVDSGPGNDLVWAYDGTDTCLDTERARSCEVREAPGRALARSPVVSCAGGGRRGPARRWAAGRQSLSSQMTAPLVTVAPTSAFRPVTVPALWALSGCSIFIASSTTTTSPSATV